MKTYGKVDVKILIFLASALAEGEIQIYKTQKCN
jgi:hypothetical protein